MTEVYLARQPIFNRKQNVFGYELLYRSCMDNFCSEPNKDKATSEVIANSFLLFGLENITRGEKAFINFTRKLLDDEVATLLPKELLVVELLEDINPDEDVYQACLKLKKMGYMIALDDFTYSEPYEPFIEMADFIKVDFLKTPIKERESLARSLSRFDGDLIAEKVETIEDFNHAYDVGYKYFQGYYFSRPHMLSGRDVTGRKLNFVKLLHEVRKPEMDFGRVEEIIKYDPALTYKLLRFINSLTFSFKVEIHSVRQALVLLGQKEVAKWVLLVSLRSIGEDKTDELITLAIHRSRFCELLAPLVGQKKRETDFFLMGMFSLIDAFFDQPMQELLAHLPIPGDIKEALLGQDGVLYNVYSLVLSYEKGNWDKATALMSALDLTREAVTGSYLESLRFANEVRMH